MSNFEFHASTEGIELSLSKVGRKLFSTNVEKIPVKDWSSNDNSELLSGLVALEPLIQELSIADLDSEKLLAPHDFIASLSDLQAHSLSLPVSMPYQLRIMSSGRLTDNSYELDAELLDGNSEVYWDSRIGSILNIGRTQYRVPSPIFDLLEELTLFGGSRDEKLEGIARVVCILGADPTTLVNPDKALANVRIRSAAAFSVSIKGDLEAPLLSPVLFARHVADEHSSDGNVISENQQILTSNQAEDFGGQFAKSGGRKGTFLLRSGEYVYIEPSLRESLNAFHTVITGDEKVRRAFVKAPRAVMSELMDDQQSVIDALHFNFIETAEFSDRVLGVDHWRPAELPFYVSEANDWGTEVLIIRPDGQLPISVTKSSLKSALEILQEAKERGEPTCQIEGQTVQVSDRLIDIIADLLPERPEDPNPAPVPAPDIEPDDPVSGPFAVITRSSFEELNYSPEITAPKLQFSAIQPRALKPSTRLLAHQETGYEWLISARNTGLPGVIMADDMGLGKTLQALCFLSSYREQIPASVRKPILIVAPTGLLSNWLQEIETHLITGGLGAVLRVFGTGIRALKSGKGRDTDSGIPMLDLGRLRSSDVVLTTYETARDYQQSFAQIEFGVAVFDEIQKAKNPRSFIRQGLSAINAGFKIGLSGTPVENSIADLWVLMDIVAEGLIKKSLKEFIAAYSGDLNQSETLMALTNLHSELLQSRDDLPPPIMRRMKDEVFKDKGPDGAPMPKKIIHSSSETTAEMPIEQASQYEIFLNQVSSGKIEVIKALHAFKQVSLSPRKPDVWVDDPISFIAASARLSVVFKILDDIHRKREKAIIFLESRLFQEPLSRVVKERYWLKQHPLIINGSVSGAARQERVNQFQNGDSGFDVIIISPKAGGVGITLTAANHVIHMERWWNPAVEDQCNDRAYRIGQKQDVHIYTPIAQHPQLHEKSFDSVLNTILEHKRRLAMSLLVPTEIGPGEISDGLFGGRSIGNRRFGVKTENELYELETGEDFEIYVADLLKHHGYKVSLTPRSWDKGCDLVAVLGEQRLLLQCKQVTSDKVLSKGVGEVIASRDFYGAVTKLVLVTNAKSISATQMREAKISGVLVATQKHLIVENGRDFLDLLSS